MTGSGGSTENVTAVDPVVSFLPSVRAHAHTYTHTHTCAQKPRLCGKDADSSAMHLLRLVRSKFPKVSATCDPPTSVSTPTPTHPPAAPAAPAAAARRRRRCAKEAGTVAAAFQQRRQKKEQTHIPHSSQNYENKEKKKKTSVRYS